MSSQSEDNLQLLFPTAIQLSQLRNHERINENLINAVNEIRSTERNSKPQSWACDLFTTIGNPQTLLNHSATKEFLYIAKEKIVKYAESFNYHIPESSVRINECWLNIYETGHSQEIHIHKNSMFSGIYYVKAPEGSGATLFYSPSSDVMLEPLIKEGNNLNTKVTGYPPVEGRMMIFRSSLRHSVLPGTITNGERITIAFNAVV